MLPFQVILDHQRVPASARLVFLALIGACLCDIGESVPHPVDPARTLLNKLEAILFIWGKGGTGKSTLLSIISDCYNGSKEVVQTLENVSSTHFGLEKIKHAYTVIAHDIDSNFNLSPTQLTQMTSGAPLAPPTHHHLPSARSARRLRECM